MLRRKRQLESSSSSTSGGGIAALCQLQASSALIQRLDEACIYSC